ncbi:hypothetical protein B9Z55_000744 [Caenorhabditis nigoni]|nr:hypothetical protein B9Z55_000744 [Caenorhabditis nigoni]
MADLLINPNLSNEEVLRGLQNARDQADSLRDSLQNAIDCFEPQSKPLRWTNSETLLPKAAEKAANVDSMVPGVGQKVWVRTWGCSHNTSDSEYMAGLLHKAGYDVLKEGENADVWVLNSCTVKTSSEQQANNLIVQGQGQGKKIIMAGCVSQAAPSEPWLQNVSIVGVKQID